MQCFNQTIGYNASGSILAQESTLQLFHLNMKHYLSFDLWQHGCNVWLDYEVWSWLFETLILCTLSDFVLLLKCGPPFGHPHRRCGALLLHLTPGRSSGVWRGWSRTSLRNKLPAVGCSNDSGSLGLVLQSQPSVSCDRLGIWAKEPFSFGVCWCVRTCVSGEEGYHCC